MAMEATAHVMAKINHLNREKTDAFMLAMIEKRADLRGLPFLMGDECRTREEQARLFRQIADLISRTKHGNMGQAIETGEHLEVVMLRQGHHTTPGFERQDLYRVAIAAITQILMPEPEIYRLGMVRYLAKVPHADASRALAKLVLYSSEESVRNAAIDGLKTRREKDFTDILLQGFRYPLQDVSKRAAEALVKLERKDLLENLVQVLESPDPRLPITEKREGKDVTFARELVKVNHHRNCLLCHAPGNTEDMPEGGLEGRGAVAGRTVAQTGGGGLHEHAAAVAGYRGAHRHDVSAARLLADDAGEGRASLARDAAVRFPGPHARVDAGRGASV